MTKTPSWKHTAIETPFILTYIPFEAKVATYRQRHAASIFRAELYALLLAIDVVRRSKEKNFAIFSDSMSSLQSINGFNLDSDLVQKFLKDYTVLAKNGKNIILCWIPSHVGIVGNVKADAAAKSALSSPITRM